ncbi:zonadhesin-like [Lissotriton helveticus]
MMMKIQLFFLLLVLDVSLMWVNGECREHQHMSACGAGCQQPCEKRNEIKPCVMMCVPGCVCDEEYILEHEGSQNCVRKQDCESCPENTYFSPCGKLCQRTCQTYKQEKIACVLSCNPGCVCVKGFVLHNDKCIPESECE